MTRTNTALHTLPIMYSEATAEVPPAVIPCKTLKEPLPHWSQPLRSGLASGIWTGSDWSWPGHCGVKPKEVESTVNPAILTAIYLT